MVYHPITNLASVLARIGETLDLRAVLTERYGVSLEAKGERWSGECPLPSTVVDFTGSCADQDASEQNSNRPANLWVSVGERTLVWRCHSCQRHGDVVDLIGYADGVPRDGVQVGLGAVRRAAELAGLGWMMDGATGPRAGRDVVSLDLALAEPVVSPLRSTATVDIDHARVLNSHVRRMWSANLEAPDAAAARARAELERRGVSIEQARRHGIGYARAGTQISDWLRGLEDAATVLALACEIGLIKTRVDERTGERRYYDAQRERLVFPYADPAPSGRYWVSGFAGRALVDPLPPNVPKWLNSATVPGLWSKKSALLGLPSAVRLADASKRCVVSEGGYDVLAWERAEIPAVAPVGVDFTVQHATVLQRLGFRVLVFAFDGDAGGRRAVPSAFAAALVAGYSIDDLYVIDVADGLDPDDLSHDDMQRAFDCPSTIVDFVTTHAALLREHSEQCMSLLSYLPERERIKVAALLSVDTARIRDRIDPDATPGQRIVRALLAHATACAFLSASDVEALLAPEPHLLALVRGIAFGEVTDEERLPLTLRRELAEARLARARKSMEADAKLDLWRYGQTIEGYRRAWAEREQAIESVKQCEIFLRSLDGTKR